MRRTTIFMAAALCAAPAQAVSQDLSEGVEPGAAAPREDDDDGNSRLGLLGLLGLAGLLGLMRREPDIHIDARGGGGKPTP